MVLKGCINSNTVLNVVIKKFIEKNKANIFYVCNTLVKLMSRKVQKIGNG